MKKTLIAYKTNSGTTADVAKAIGEELSKLGNEIDVLPLEEVRNLSQYDAVVLGAPMIMGWHKDALNFLKKNKNELSKIPLFIFATAMNLTKPEKTENQKINLHVDEKLAQPPTKAGRLTFKENWASVNHYLQPIVKASPTSLRAVSFFGGRLDYYRLKWWEAAFVMLIIGAKPGEKRNWPDIRAWAASLQELLEG